MVGDILQPTHLLLILVVALLVLGPKRLPEVGRTLGSGLRDFRQAINGESTSHDDHDEHGAHAYVETEPEETVPYVAEPEDLAAPVAVADDHAAAAAPDVAGTETPSTVFDDAETTSAEPAEDAELAAPVSTSEPAESRAASASSAGFASALAASRQRPGDDELTDDE
jgi:TatA/E family protein of Tat protein translocase